ncbi:MAG: hypothetical protein PHN84_01075 [Desulfuromonadaceae bacterium]|nr:hypothetical protein [Desulfuromonadaceae bacterium]MDD2854037.1 hypothetical protein [Desulfuromonadaceae bacterium]
MAHDGQKVIQKASLIGRILSMETFLLLMGLASLFYGISKDIWINIFWGCVIIPGVFILHKVRKKDWAKHWADMEAEHKSAEARAELRRKIAEETQRTGKDGK